MTSVSIAGVLLYAVAIVVVFRAIMNARTPQGAVGWTVFVLALPWLGIPVYLLFGYARVRTFARAKREAIERISEGAIAALPPDDEQTKRLAVFDAVSDHTVTRGGGLELLTTADQTFQAMFQAIEGAGRYVLVQFYTIRDDAIGGEMAKVLISAAERGVRVRVLVDAVGSVALSRAYTARLSEAGVSVVAQRGPSRSFGRFGLNFRNHRKIVVADGEVAFTGGFNVGDEYLDDWRDTHARLSGPLVAQLQSEFAQDWLVETGEDIEGELNWTPEADPSDMHGLVLNSGPTDPFESGVLYFAALAQSARRRLWIATPYLVPDPTVLAALKLAALRGVEVRILVPEVPDRWIPWIAAFTHFDELRGAGCEIWRYQPYFMHQKVALVDDDILSVGSINVDARSSLLNYESTVIVSDRGAAREAEAMLEADFAESVRLRKDLHEQPLWLRFSAPLARLLSPLL